MQADINASGNSSPGLALSIISLMLAGGLCALSRFAVARDDSPPAPTAPATSAAAHADDPAAAKTATAEAV